MNDLELLDRIVERYNTYEYWEYYDEECESWTTGRRLKQPETKEHFTNDLFEV